MDTLLRTAQVSAILGVSNQTVRRYADRGDLPVVRHPINNRRVFRKSEVDALAQKLVESGVLELEEE